MRSAIPAGDAAGPSTPQPAAEPAPGIGRTAPEIARDLLDPDALKVVRHLRRTGFDAYLVGGCVRDLLLGVRPKDFDIATSAHPQEVKSSFRNCRLIGRRFRLAHVYFRGGKVIEVATFRANPREDDPPAGGQQDLLIKHDNVFGTVEEDARRRDFTINGLFYDVEAGRVIDHVGGKEDLAARRIRTIGDSGVRMREDPVRILRAVRFAAKCGLSFEPSTLAAMKEHIEELSRCAPPRVLEELLKLARSGASRRCLELLRDVGALRILLPPVEQVFGEEDSAFARQLLALEALDTHVKADEVPSDTVLLATLLLPLPRTGAPHGPIPKVPHPAASAAPEETAGAEPELAPGEEERPPEAEEVLAVPDESAESDDELDPELAALEAQLDAPEEGEADVDGDGEGEGPEVGEADGEGETLPASDGEEGEPAMAAPPGGEPDKKGAAAEGAPWSLPARRVPAETVLTEMVRTARLPRRIAERARLLLQSQAYLAGERRRRGLQPTEFVRQSIFPEAIALFELNVAATGRGGETLKKWQDLFLGQPVAELLAEEPPGAERSRRRRRRGGRGRRRPS